MSDLAGAIVLAGRILVSLFFLNAARSHIAGSKQTESFAGSVGFPLPGLAGWPTGLWLLAGGLSVGLGVWPDVGALMLGAFVIPAALYFHQYWKEQDPMQKRTQQMLFFRNMFILGTALIIFGFFASAGDGLRFAVTEALFSLD